MRVPCIQVIKEKVKLLFDSLMSSRRTVYIMYRFTLNSIPTFCDYDDKANDKHSTIASLQDGSKYISRCCKPDTRLPGTYGTHSRRTSIFETAVREMHTFAHQLLCQLSGTSTHVFAAGIASCYQ